MTALMSYRPAPQYVSAFDRGARLGISLLEVLISIGILSIGLLSAMALIPAGRTYIKQAELDDRTATLVPAAIATMEAFGLFHENSLEWISPPRPPFDDGEQTALRPAFAADALRAYRTASPDQQADRLRQLNAARWPGATASAATTAVLDPEMWPNDPQPSAIFGDLPETEPTQGLITVRFQRRANGKTFEKVAEFDAATGSWQFSNPLDEVDEPPAMKIKTEPPGVGQIDDEHIRWQDYEIVIEYFNDSPQVNNWVEIPYEVKLTDSLQDQRGLGNLKPYRHYGARRKRDELDGPTTLALTVAPKDNRNDAPGDATELPVPTFADFVEQQKVRMVRSVTLPVHGQLWRFHTGTIGSQFQIERLFNNSEAEHDTPAAIATTYPLPLWELPAEDPLSVQPGDKWDPNDPATPGWVSDDEETEQPYYPDTPEDKDYYQFPVEAGTLIRFDWSPTHESDRLDSTYGRIFPNRAGTGLFPIEFQQDTSNPWRLLEPSSYLPTSVSYSIPNDGLVRTGLCLKPHQDDNRNINTIYYDNDFLLTGPRNYRYQYNLSVSRQDRMIAIDPLMCTHLDRIIQGAPATHPLSLRRRRFADFQQWYQGDPANPRAFVIPRLNWRVLAENPNFDAAIEVAESLCRAEDTLAVEDGGDADASPEPVFTKRAVNGPSDIRPVKRQAAGRMTWMLTVQPEDPGSVAANWYAGKYFETSIVVFQDRPIPKQGAVAMEGQYAFESSWDDLDGLLRIRVRPLMPGDTMPEDDDLRRLLGPGSWVLLAPRFTIAAPTNADAFSLEWSKILRADFEQLPNTIVNGEVVKEVLVTALLEREPGEMVIQRQEASGLGLVDSAGRYPLMALCYDGIVNVIRRSMVVKEPLH